MELDNIYHTTALHSDEEPPSLAWMVLLEGQKTFHFLPPKKIPEKIANDPLFVTEDAVARFIPQGLMVVELLPGDLLCFPGNWLHEVHNKTPDSLAVTNAVPMPKAPSTEGDMVKRPIPSKMLGKRRTRGTDVNPFAL